MSGKADPGSLEFEKVSLTDARKALDETGPAAYAAPRKVENWRRSAPHRTPSRCRTKRALGCRSCRNRSSRGNSRCAMRASPIGCARRGRSRRNASACSTT